MACHVAPHCRRCCKPASPHFDGRRIRRCDWQRVFVRSGAQSPTCKATRCCDVVHSCMCLCHRLNCNEISLYARCPSGGGDRPEQVHRSATTCSCKASAGGVTLPADKSSAHAAVMSERDIVWDRHALQHASCFLHKARQSQRCSRTGWRRHDPAVGNELAKT